MTPNIPTIQAAEINHGTVRRRHRSMTDLWSMIVRCFITLKIIIGWKIRISSSISSISSAVASGMAAGCATKSRRINDFNCGMIMNRRREPCYHCRRWQGYWVRQAVPKVRMVNPLGDYKFQQSKLSEETGGIILVVYSNLAIVLTWLGEVSESLKLNVEHPLTDSQVWDSDSGYFTARVSKGRYESGNQILSIWKKKKS